MKEEYDFSSAERGKFFRPEAKFNLPIYLEEEVLEFFSQRAETKGVDLNVLLNDLLKKNIALLRAVEQEKTSKNCPKNSKSRVI